MAVIIEWPGGGYPRADRGRDWAVWTRDGRTVRVSAEENTLLLVATDDSIQRMSLPPGYVADAIKRRPDNRPPFSDDFRKIFLSDSGDLLE